MSDSEQPASLQTLFCQRRKLKQLLAAENLRDYVAGLIETNGEVAETMVDSGLNPQACLDLESNLIVIEQLIDEIEEQNGGFAD